MSENENGDNAPSENADNAIKENLAYATEIFEGQNILSQKKFSIDGENLLLNYSQQRVGNDA